LWEVKFFDTDYRFSYDFEKAFNIQTVFGCPNCGTNMASSDKTGIAIVSAPN